MRILFFINNLGSGGKERRLVELIKHLSKKPKYDLGLVLTKKEVHYEGIFSTGIKIYFIERHPKIKKDISLFFKFFSIIKKFDPDIIHVWENMVAIYSIPSKLILKKPLINNQITNALDHSKSLFKHNITFDFSDKIIANTYSGLKAYKAPKKKSIVIYNGFDFNRIKGLESIAEVRNKFNIDSKYIVGMVASFTKKKDYKSYINAAIQVLEKRKDITFLCVGSGNYVEFEESISEYYKKNILFLGNQEDVESIMNICDLGVLMTSENHLEGISNSILEFNALSKPVIASKGGGTYEIIKDNISGFLIDAGDFKTLANRIELLIDTPELLFKLGENAKEIVHEKFSINRMVAEFEEVYKDLIKKS